MPTKNMGIFKFSDAALVEEEAEDVLPGGQMPCGTTVPTWRMV